MRVAPRRGVRIRANVFEALIAVLAIVTCAGFFADPHSLAQTAVAQATGNLSVEWAWNVGYGTAGVLILTGLAAFRPHVEVAGLVLLATASLMETIALLVATGGLTPFGVGRQVVTFAVVAAASLVRAHMLVSGEDVAVVRTVKAIR